MAKFPDEPAFGGAPAIAPESGSARDAQLAQDAAPELALETARAESHYLVRTKELRDVLAGEPGGGLVEKYAPLFRQAHDDSAALISDPRQREWWAQRRTGDMDGELAAVSDWSRTLARDSEIAGAAAQLDALRQSALDTADPTARTPFIEAAGGLIAGLHAAGHIGEPDAKERQKTWAEDFALAAFSRLPAAERVRLLGESPDGENGQGGLAGLIPAARRESLQRSAQLDLRNDELAAQSAAALAKYQAESRIRDDLVSMLKTGKGADDLAADDVQATLGPDTARRWREAREDYRLIHDHSHDLHALTESAIAARLRALKPEDEEAESREAAVFRAVQEQAGELRQMRLADPARSVAGDPLVRAAQERAQSGDEGARRALHAARLAAEERAGIAPDAQSPITKGEALTLVAPLRGVEAGQERDVLRRLGEDFVARFGPDAERTLAFALRALKSDAQDIAAAKQMLNAVELREGIVPGDPQSPDAAAAPGSATAESATAESGTQSGLPSAIAPETLAENSETPLPFTDDPLFGWNAIGSQTQERDGFEVALASLMAASGGGKRKAIGKAIDFLRGVLFPPPPPEPGKEPPRNEPPPDITPLIPNERRRVETPAPLTDGEPRLSAIKGPEADDLRRRVAAKASPGEIVSHPVIRDVVARMEAIAPTGSQVDFENPEFRAARIFNFAGEQVIGYDNAIFRLVDVARAYSKGGLVRNEAIATIVIGQPAAGKSEFAKRIASKRFSAIIDSDDAKPIMREYANGIGTTAVHAESIALADEVLAKLVASHANIVLPKIGGSAAQIESIVRELRASGYRVDLVHVNVPMDEALRRNALRYLDDGRLVPPQFIVETSSKPRLTYYYLKNKGLIHETAEIDNSGPIGNARVIEASGELANVFR